MRRRARNDRDDEGRAGEAAEFLRPSLFVEVGLVLEPDHQRDAAGALARGALEHDEAPRRELAVVGHARGKAEDRLELLGRRARAGHQRPAARSGGA